MGPLLCCASLLHGQLVPLGDDGIQTQPAQTIPTATVHGIVRNAVTGSPLPRALVRLRGGFGPAALTDGDGRFEIPGVPTGEQEFTVIKPGFFDGDAPPSGGFVGPGAREAGHTIAVATEMPDLVFTLSPLNAIRGEILLASGEPAQGMAVTLLKQSVEGGRTLWQVTARTNVNADGAYRFGGLTDGLYAVHTDFAMENDGFTPILAAGSAARITRNGYPARFYPEGNSLSSAAKIRLQGGETVEAEMSLALELFHAITARVLFQGGAPPRQMQAGDESGVSYSPQILDAQGHQLPYLAQFDSDSNTVQALLPDGTYTLLVTASTLRPVREPSRVLLTQDPVMIAGEADFTVAGHAISNLRVPLTMIRTASIQVDSVRTNVAAIEPASADAAGQMRVILTLTDASGSNEGYRQGFAQGPLSGPLHTSYTPPGSYWVHTEVHDRSMCEGSLMAGATNLAREPLVLGLSGPTEPVTLTLRDDCASLTIALPASLTAQTAGEEPQYTVYVVPDFDSTLDVFPLTLRASTGTSVTFDGLTPGRYRVYTFAKPSALAYHDTDALAASPESPQEIDLAPGAKANLVVEVPKQ